MRILAAFDKFKDSFSAQTACELLERVAYERDPSLEVKSCPLTDGGEGFVEILASRFESRIVPISVRDAYCEEKDVSICLVDIANLNEEARTLLDLPNSGKLAILEMASVCGLSDLPKDRRNPWKTSSVGVGDMLLHARKAQADFILLGIGGSSTNDAGLGALCSLGLKVLDGDGKTLNSVCPEFWQSVADFDSQGLASLPPIRIACDVSNPLLGSDGATKQYARQKGLPENDLDRMEHEMQRLSGMIESSLCQTESKKTVHGSGAAGGLGFGLSLVYDVRLIGGAELLCSWFEIEKEIARADLVFTGEGRFDRTSFSGKGPFKILKMAQHAHKPSVMICGTVEDGLSAEISESFPRVSCKSISNPDWDLRQNIRSGPSLFLDACHSALSTISGVGPVECPVVRDARFKRIRRLKRFLRPLPRRSNVHRYPVLKWFSETAYRRSYLWSFKGREIKSALFFGIWISMLPIVGIQMVVVFFLALLVRANLPIIVALQWISNPLTMGPIYFADYKIGMNLIELLGIDYPRNKLLSQNYDWTHFSYKELIRLIDTFPPMFAGGSLLGISLGVLAVFLYKILSRFYKI